MKNKLPSIKSQTKICIICEGDEEYEYLERLKSLEMWNTITPDCRRAFWKARWRPPELEIEGRWCGWKCFHFRI